MSQYKFKINGKDYEVRIDGIEGGIAKVNVNGVNYDVELEAAAAGLAPSDASHPFGPTSFPPLTTGAPGNSPISGEGTRAARSSGTSQPSAAEQVSAPASDSTSGHSSSKVVSPLPGVIIEVCVGPGEVVKKGQRIAVIEAMKMENDILAETTGRISEVYVKKGDSVLEGADIASIA